MAAHEQSAGRGRLDRVWQVPAGTAVTMSVTLPLPRDTQLWGWVPLFVGNAVRLAVGDVAPELRCAVKWPNDLLVETAVPGGAPAWLKAAGVLCQVATRPTGALVVAGVGLNVAQTWEELPVKTATSLALAGADVTRDEMLAALAARLLETGQRWGDADAAERFKADVRAHCATIGADVDVHEPGGAVVARHVTAIDDDGRLVTTAPGGAGGTVIYSVADVEHVRARG